MVSDEALGGLLQDGALADEKHATADFMQHHYEHSAHLARVLTDETFDKLIIIIVSTRNTWCCGLHISVKYKSCSLGTTVLAAHNGYPPPTCDLGHERSHTAGARVECYVSFWETVVRWLLISLETFSSIFRLCVVWGFMMFPAKISRTSIHNSRR